MLSEVFLKGSANYKGSSHPNGGLPDMVLISTKKGLSEWYTYTSSAKESAPSTGVQQPHAVRPKRTHAKRTSA